MSKLCVFQSLLVSYGLSICRRPCCRSVKMLSMSFVKLIISRRVRFDPVKLKIYIRNISEYREQKASTFSVIIICSLSHRDVQSDCRLLPALQNIFHGLGIR